jgi:hypothetical protein
VIFHNESVESGKMELRKDLKIYMQVIFQAYIKWYRVVESAVSSNENFALFIFMPPKGGII